MRAHAIGAGRFLAAVWIVCWLSGCESHSQMWAKSASSPSREPQKATPSQEKTIQVWTEVKFEPSSDSEAAKDINGLNHRFNKPEALRLFQDANDCLILSWNNFPLQVRVRVPDENVEFALRWLEVQSLGAPLQSSEEIRDCFFQKWREGWPIHVRGQIVVWIFDTQPLAGAGKKGLPPLEILAAPKLWQKGR